MNTLKTCRNCGTFYNATTPLSMPHRWGCCCDHCDESNANTMYELRESYARDTAAEIARILAEPNGFTSEKLKRIIIACDAFKITVDELFKEE